GSDMVFSRGRKAAVQRAFQSALKGQPPKGAIEKRHDVTRALRFCNSWSGTPETPCKPAQNPRCYKLDIP
ncbi:MAG TPA: hypothetical protein VK509_25285, partial [Polyangiales bacterium]|nr:hypothetical protein [Polyangiales bacterium]